jgi:hypothetical protein
MGAKPPRGTLSRSFSHMRPGMPIGHPCLRSKTDRALLSALPRFLSAPQVTVVSSNHPPEPLLFIPFSPCTFYHPFCLQLQNNDLSGRSRKAGFPMQPILTGTCSSPRRRLLSAARAKENSRLCTPATRKVYQTALQASTSNFTSIFFGSIRQLPVD